MSEFEVREVKSDKYDIWDELVVNSPHGTIFHTSNWLTLCNKSLKEDLKIYGCFKDEDLVGGCSLFVHKSKGIFKTASSTCAMTPYGGIVLKQPSSYKARKQVREHHEIMKYLCNAIDKNNFESIRITNPPNFLDIRPFTWNGWNSTVLYAYLLDLDSDFENTLTRDVRRNLKKANENKIQIRKSGDLKTHYELFKRLFERQNLNPPANYVFFENLSELLSKNMWDIWVAETSSGQIATSQIILFDDKTAYLWTNASDPAHIKSGANTLLYYSAFQELKSKGFKGVNMMSANLPQFTEFATAFNPKLIPYYSINKKSIKFQLITNAYNMLNKSRSYAAH